VAKFLVFYLIFGSILCELLVLSEVSLLVGGKCSLRDIVN